MRELIVAPSILSADFSCIEAEVEKISRTPSRFIHLDVMDGKFVPNTTFGPELVKRIAPYCGSMVKDTHLMVANPHEMVEDFIAAGSDLITFHYESYNDDEARLSCIRHIKKAGAKVGMSIKPNTAPEVLLPFFKELDLVLIMSVEPGKGGQKFMENSLQKIAFCRKNIDELGKDIYLEVDGGINQETAKLVVEAGADVLVAGSYIFGHGDYQLRIQGMLDLWAA
ncbi:MAG: ribulose-phosphate 3-epimerase [Bacilli bacterium]|nr:ribulose-phosphate 3-epimerase [Bacilli bacterium]